MGTSSVVRVVSAQLDEVKTRSHVCAAQSGALIEKQKSGYGSAVIGRLGFCF
jgi:hypothetical protein